MGVWYVGRIESHTDVRICLFALSLSLSLSVEGKYCSLAQKWHFSGPGFHVIILPWVCDPKQVWVQPSAYLCSKQVNQNAGYLLLVGTWQYWYCFGFEAHVFLSTFALLSVDLVSIIAFCLDAVCPVLSSRLAGRKFSPSCSFPQPVCVLSGQLFTPFFPCPAHVY